MREVQIKFYRRPKDRELFPKINKESFLEKVRFNLGLEILIVFGFVALGEHCDLEENMYKYAEEENTEHVP